MIFGVVGNRIGWNSKFIFSKLDELILKRSDIIISGGCEGVDSFAQDYAKEKGLEIIIVYPRPWLPSPQRYFDRNTEIATRCDVLVAFDKGSSGSGTLNTINTAKKDNKRVILFKNEKEIKKLKKVIKEKNLK